MKKLMLSVFFCANTFAGSAQYIFQDQTTGAGQRKSVMKTASNDLVRFEMNQNKRMAAETTVKKVVLNGKEFDIELQDEFDVSQRVPFFKVNFEHFKERDIFALSGTKGTSGSQLHYFMRKSDGEFIYSGLLPEIYFDEDEKKFLSVEKDGPRAFVSEWTIKSDKFVLVKSWEEK